MAAILSMTFLLFIIVCEDTLAALPIGFHDATDCNSLRGWTCDMDDPAHPVAVHFYEGSTFLGGMYAEIRREDAVGVQCGSTSDIRHLQHGYAWTVPEQLRDNINHTITIYAIDPQNPNEHTILNSAIYNCSPTSTAAGFWDEGIVNGRTQSDYSDLGCPGAEPLRYGPCLFLPAGGTTDFWTSAPEDSFGDQQSTVALFENCPTSDLQCPPSAAGVCASGAKTFFPACNTYTTGEAYTSDSFWEVDVNNEAANPYGPFHSASTPCAADPQVGPPNKALPIMHGRGGIVQLWRSTASTGKRMNMRLATRYANPCGSESIPFLSFGAAQNRGNNSQPIALIRYPADDVVRRKAISFTQRLKANRTWETPIATRDVHLAYLFLEAVWNGRKRQIFIELGGVVPSTYVPASTYREWNWPLVQSRFYPGAIIGFNPLNPQTSQPWVPFLPPTIRLQRREITLNLEDVFQSAIDRSVWPHPTYPNDATLIRFMLGDPPSANTLIPITAVHLVQEVGRDPNNGPTSWLYTSVQRLRTLETP